jgi:glycosyltransferase involved in cell wall biosynthesis
VSRSLRRVSQQLPSFDLVVATVGRTAELARFLDSVAAQDYPAARVIVVDQNDDSRLEDVFDGRTLRAERTSSPRGLSRARNAGLELVEADVVAFPDDDCVYPPGLLAHVAEKLGADSTLAGLTGQARDAHGRSAASWKTDGAILTDDNLWNRAISFTIFLRREIVDAVGPFDEALGLGSGTQWSSSEEIDYLVRTVRAGARIEYDPSLVVEHDVRPDTQLTGARDGASIGYLLRKHGYPVRIVSRMLARPFGGALLSLLRLDVDRSRFHLATLRGRVRGYRGANRSNSSA